VLVAGNKTKVEVEVEVEVEVKTKRITSNKQQATYLKWLYILN